MKEDKNYIWAKFCSLLSNEKNQTQQLDFLKSNLSESDKKTLEMIKKDVDAIEKAAYMYDEETNEAWRELHSKINTMERPRNGVISIVNHSFFRVAASLIFVIGLSWLTYELAFNQDHIIESQMAQKIEILPDGSKITLNSNSSIEYPKNFNKKNREVKLNGEAFFEIKRDEERPFIITAGEANITVLGTSFNILTNKNSKDVEVMVESGVVSLSAKSLKDDIILTKGELGLYQSKSLEKKTSTDLNYLSWKTKVLTFENAHLNYVVNVLNRTYNTHITFDSNNSEDYMLNATFNEAPLSTVLESICLAFDLEKKDLGNSYQLVSKTK